MSGQGRWSQRGSMAAELTIITPLLLVFLMLLAGLGRLIDAQGQVDGAARDAARAASLQRSGPTADDASAAGSATGDAASGGLAGGRRTTPAAHGGRH